MKVKETDIIGEVVAKDYRSAAIFKKAGIDFCCRGNRSIESAIEKKGEMSNLLNSLNHLLEEQKGNQDIDFQSWPLDLLADYIEKTHHRYVEEKIKEIKPFLRKVVSVHGKSHPELIEVHKEFLKSAGELGAHMKKEELIIFPFIRKMIAKQKNKEGLEKAQFGSLANPIEMMKEEHDQEGKRYRRIASLTNNYSPPADACNTFRVSYAMLKEFEENLHQHIHLENNILFPKAIELEKTF